MLIIVAVITVAMATIVAAAEGTIAAEGFQYGVATVLIGISGMDYAILTARCLLSFRKVGSTTDIDLPA